MISKWHSWIWTLQYHGWWEHWCEQHGTACNLYMVGGQGDDSMRGIYWSDANEDVLLPMNHRIQDARRQCYDGCSTMVGSKNRIAAQNKKLNEKCLLTHCYCHSLHLAAGDTIKSLPLLKESLDMAYEITNLIKKSPKREAEFHRTQAELLGQMESDIHVYNMDSPTLKILCPKWWTVWAASRSAILKNYGTLMKL